MEPKRILEVLLRRKWIVIQAFTFIFLTAVVGSHFLPPFYETSAKLLFETPSATSSLLSTMGMKEIAALIPPSPQRADIGTKVTLAKINPLLEKVILKLQIRDDQGNLLNPKRLLSDSLLPKLSPNPFVSVLRDIDSDTITITARSADPDEAMFLANSLAEIYVKDSEREKRREVRSAYLFVQDQIGKVKQDYYDALQVITAFRERHQTIDLGTEIRVAIEKMAELMKEKEDNIIDIAETRAKIRTFKKQFKEQTSLPVPASFIKDNPQIQKLKEDLSRLKLKLADLLTDETEEHPDVVAVRQQIKQVEAELEKEAQVHRSSSPELRELNDLERELAALKVHLEGVNHDIEGYLDLFKALPEKTSEEARLKLGLTVSQNIYSSLLDYSYRIGVAEAMALSDVRLVEPALRPTGPKGPNKIFNGIMGAFLGLVFGLGLAFFAESVDDTLRAPEELEEYKELVFLGSVPQIGKNKLIARLDANDPVSEAYRTVRHSIKFASLDRPVKSILITSGGPDEGKTLMVANLGISFSQTGVRVLIADTDLRRPNLHGLFRKSNRIGLTNVIADECPIEEATVDTDIQGLSLLPSGPTPPDPGRIIESAKLKDLIYSLSARYDVVILDSAPLLIKSDATILGHYLDGVIYIVEAGKTSRRAITEAWELLKKANLRPIGTILNKYREMKPHYPMLFKRKRMGLMPWRSKARVWRSSVIQ